MLHLFIFLSSCFSVVHKILTSGLTDEQIHSESDQMKMDKLNNVRKEKLANESILLSIVVSFECLNLCLGSYQVENTGSRSIPEVKQPRAESVLGRETAWEHSVS